MTPVIYPVTGGGWLLQVDPDSDDPDVGSSPRRSFATREDAARACVALTGQEPVEGPEVPF